MLHSLFLLVDLSVVMECLQLFAHGLLYLPTKRSAAPVLQLDLRSNCIHTNSYLLLLPFHCECSSHRKYTCFCACRVNDSRTRSPSICSENVKNTPFLLTLKSTLFQQLNYNTMYQLERYQ